ncbi:MAG: hypothetical protein LBN06_09450 [Prevotellaceae bacterium]|jgi:hypothetical protein|nr:hypothetical protein [Prevotellaceae bacterium]
MDTSLPNEKIPQTLDELVARRREMRQAVRAQQQKMTDLARASFASVERTASKGESMVRAFQTGMAVFDGILLGMKIIRRIRRLI